MNAKGKGHVYGVACDKKNKSLTESSTGIVPSQQHVIATGKFRADVLAYLRSLPSVACINDHFELRHDGPNSVLSCGFQRRDASEAIEVEITLHDWRPLSSIPVLDLCAEVHQLWVSAGYAATCARLSTRNGRTILTSSQPRELIEDLRELKTAASKLFDRIEDQNNWLPIPDDLVVSVRWFAVQPTGGIQ